MKNHIFSIGLLAVLAISCSIHEMDFKDANAFEEFYASIENAETPDTKVFATEELYLRWNADDRITIFNKYTYNQEYRFTGETGDNSGSFKRVDNGDFVTGNSLDNIYAIYPYLESTRISDTGVITVTLPSEQKYAENTMGLGANTMMSATADNQLLFKNVGGYLMLKLYGDDVTVSSITLKGNNGERIAGKATVSMPINGVPTVAMSETAGQEITLVCETPVKIGSTAETATTFWIVVPPTVFSNGFTLTVKDSKNGVFEKATSKSFEISRNKLARMSALEVSPIPPEPSDEAIVFADQKLKERLVAKFDTNGDGELSYKEAAAVTSIEGAVSIKTITSFDEFQYFTGVTIIPDSYFKDWAHLSRITLPLSLTNIGNYAFQNCTSLTIVNLPEGLTTIGRYAFQNCSTLSSIDIPDSVTSLGTNSFQDCSALTNINYSNSIGAIPNYAFQNCTSLNSFITPKGVNYIGTQAFAGCSSLQSINFPEGLTYIYDRAFSGCSSLTSIAIPKTVSYIEIAQYITIYNYVTPFQGCSGLMSITVDPYNPYYDSRDNCNALIQTDNNNLFVGSNNAIIPDGVKSIQQGAFAGCSELKTITIPESVTSIGPSAFYGCSALTAITIPESIVTLENATFYGCTNLKEVSISESVTSIGFQAFAGCSSLSSITIPGSVSTIGENAFDGCQGLKSLFLSNGVMEIGNQAFTGCRALASVSIPNSVSRIGNMAFRLCTSLPSIMIPGNTVLGSRVFEGCTNLASAIIQEGADSIGGGTFANCTSLVNVELPESLKTIDAEVFDGCSLLESIDVPRHIESIGSYAFRDCSSLESITIPSCVTLIGYAAFHRCTKLVSVKCEPIVPPSGRSLMFESTNNCPIYVPASSVEAYQTAQYWSDYAYRIRPLAPLPEAVDLGLPSGLKWASYNMGASKPEEYGDYYAWGEIEPYYSQDTGNWKEGKESGYYWTSYKWCMGDEKVTKYCGDSSYGYNGFTDTKTVLDPEDDAAHVNLGGAWRMPTDAEWAELRNNCTWTWTTQNGMNGILFTANNGNSIFLPAAGLRTNRNRNSVRSVGNYWSSSLDAGYPIYALSMYFNSNNAIRDRYFRYGGFSIRPVYAE